MTLGMVLWAINGAASHVASTQGAWSKAKVAAALTYLFLKEVVGMAVLLPSLSRSILIYTSLPPHPTGMQSITVSSKGGRLRPSRTRLPWVGVFKVSVARNIPYGTAKRNLLDVYVPDAVMSEGGQRKWPAVMFVHGGAWATGSKELFAHLGAYLAHSGVVAVLVQYTLFPEVLAWEQVREVSRALTWFLDNVEHYGGDPQRVTLMGHSAGAHLCALSMWERFKAAQQLQQRQVAAKADGSASERWPDIIEDDFDERDLRQPCNFVGLAGVYDIAEHLKYEQKRGVDSMSSMTPAMGGKHLFEAMSPVHLFHSFRAGASAINASTSHESAHANVDDGVLDNMGHLGAVDAGLCRASDMDGEIEACPGVSEHADAGVCAVGGLEDSAVCRMHLPSCTLLCSWSDTVVRPDTSISFHAVLQEQLGHQSQLIMFDGLAHSDFIVLDGGLPEQVSLRRHILQILQP